MTSDTRDTASKLTRTGMQSYWRDVSARHLDPADQGLAAICYAGMPIWFNRFLDQYQRKAMSRLLAQESLAGKRVLDLGTGVGRWARWYSERGSEQVVGIDMDPARLVVARRLDDSTSYREMPIDNLDFPDASFDIVNSVTVLQHVEDDVKRSAILELSRVLKSSGKAVIFEETHTGDDAAHVFPWKKEAWKAEFEKNGLRVHRTVGDQYTPVLRAMKTGFSLLKGVSSRADIEALKDSNGGSSLPLTAALRLAVVASYPLEEAMRFLPSELAKITGFLLVKE